MTFDKNFSDKTDFELIGLSKEDPEYFGVLMSRYQEKLFWYVKRVSYFGNDDIEDILQEVLIKAYKNLNEFDSSYKFSSWIYRVAHNQVVDEIRKKQRRKESLLGEAEQKDLEIFLRSSIELEQKVLSRDCLEKAKKAIGELPLKYREAMQLRFLEEKDYEEIMDILRKPKGSVATLIGRGKKILEKKLKEAKLDCL